MGQDGYQSRCMRRSTYSAQGFCCRYSRVGSSGKLPSAKETPAASCRNLALGISSNSLGVNQPTTCIFTIEVRQ